MKKNSFLYAFLFSFLITLTVGSQTVERIRFKKDPTLIYFFQKGRKSDTLYRNAENLFYLILPDTLKKNLSLQVENGQMFLTGNDSLIGLKYLPGFKYESFYSTDPLDHEKKGKYKFETAVDGISILPHNKISVSLINKRTEGLLLENVFYYK